MKILQIVAGYFGSALYQNLFTSLEHCSIQSVIVDSNNDNVSCGIKNNDFHLYNCKSNIKRILFYPKQKYLISSIYKDIDLSDINVIHAHTLFSCGYTAWRIYKKERIPYIVAIRNTDVNTFFKYMPHLHSVGINILKDAKKVVFLSPVYRDKVINTYVPNHLREEIHQKSVVIPNGIDGLFLNNSQSKTLSERKKIRLIYVGTIDSNKNLETSIAAASVLIGKGYDVDFTAVGKIKDKKYNTLIAKTQFLRHHDKAPKEKVLEYLRSADIFLMPSHKETFGLVYAEAMSQGLPVIYTKGQGFDGQFAEGTVGYHVNPRDALDIADKIALILNDYNQMSARASELCQRFNWEKIAEEYKKIYSYTNHII